VIVVFFELVTGLMGREYLGKYSQTAQTSKRDGKEDSRGKVRTFDR
jgi:hypothetical protein